MKIDQTPGFGGHDKQYIQVVRPEVAKSIKPNIFKSVDSEVAMALFMTDAVDLSPEAKVLLRKLQEKMKYYGDNLATALEDDEFTSIFYTLKDLEKIFKKEDEKKEAKDKQDNPKMGDLKNPYQFVIPLSKEQKRREGVKPGVYNPADEILEKMIVYSTDDNVKSQLIKELGALGLTLIDEVFRFGCRIIILPKNMNLTQIKIANMSIVAPGERTFDGRAFEHVRGVYDKDRRIMVIGEERIGRLPESTARHEFAHAFDHAFSTKKQRRLPLSVQLWNLFRENRKELVSDYASTNPAEYFAESVEAFFMEKGRDHMAKNDPQMYQYLGTVFIQTLAI